MDDLKNEGDEYIQLMHITYIIHVPRLSGMLCIADDSVTNTRAQTLTRMYDSQANGNSQTHINDT